MDMYLPVGDGRKLMLTVAGSLMVPPGLPCQILDKNTALMTLLM
jgi:hypothetical protein